AVVAGVPKLREDGAEVDLSLSQLAEQSMPHGLHVIPPFGPRRSGHLTRTVLEVDVPNAAGIAGKDGAGIAAAVGCVAGIETQPDERRIGALHQRVDFLRGFDVGRAVMVK